jgi:hypothetical protein
VQVYPVLHHFIDGVLSLNPGNLCLDSLFFLGSGVQQMIPDVFLYRPSRACLGKRHPGEFAKLKLP